MLLSIIIPSYNQGRFIRENLEVLAAAKTPDMEIILIDGGSTDGTMEVIKEYQSILDYWVSESDQGQSQALNKGLAVAQGHYIGWQNSDDYYLPQGLREGRKLMRQAVETNSPENLPVIYANALIVDEAGDVRGKFAALPYSLGDLLFCSIPIPNQASFIPRKKIEAIKGWNDKLQYTMDWDLFIRLGLIQTRFIYHNRIWGAYRIHREAKLYSIAHGQKHDSFQNELLGIQEKFREKCPGSFYKHQSPTLMRSYFKIRRAFYAIKLGHWEALFRHLTKGKSTLLPGNHPGN